MKTASYTEKRRLSAIVMSAALVGLLGLSSQALALISVLAPPAGTTISVNCTADKVTLGGIIADGCAGYYTPQPSGPTEEAGLLNAVTGGNDWTFVYKVDLAPPSTAPGAIVNGIEIKLLSVTETSDGVGTYIIGWSDTNGTLLANLPVTVDLAAAFKASTEIGYFFFEAELLTDNPYSRQGTFELQVTNKNGNNLQALSHESLFVRNLTAVDPGPPVLPVPTPLALIGLGAVLLGLTRRRFSR